MLPKLNQYKYQCKDFENHIVQKKMHGFCMMLIYLWLSLYFVSNILVVSVISLPLVETKQIF